MSGSTCRAAALPPRGCSGRRFPGWPTTAPGSWPRVGRLPGVEQGLLAVGVDDRVDGRVAAAVRLLQSAFVPAPADPAAAADHRAAEHASGYFQRDGVDVVAGEVVVPGPGEAELTIQRRWRRGHLLWRVWWHRSSPVI